MAEIEMKKCAHPACECAVADEDKYCGEHCKTNANTNVEVSCNCGHEGCSPV
jgi:hypothetical protein